MASKKSHCSAIVQYLGPSAPLPVSDLPTLRDVLKHCQLHRERFVGPMTNYPVSTMVADVLPLILQVWTRANAKLVDIPVRVTDFSIMEKIKRQ